MSRHMPTDHRQVAHEFVEKYYKLLQQTPEQLYKFYKKHSSFVFSRDADGAQSFSATGQEQIHNGIMVALQPFCGHITMVSKSQIDSQASRQGGLLVLVTGQLVTYDGYCQHFTQSFFLDQQELPTPGYFVLSDFLRYVEPNPVPVQQCPPGAQSMQPGVPVMPTEAMMCQDQCLLPQLGGMPMMSPHEIGGPGQQEAWMQPRMHPSMMPQVHTVMGGEAAANGFPMAPPLPQNQPMQASHLARQPATGSRMVAAATLEEPSRPLESAFLANNSAVPEAQNGEGDAEDDGRDEAEAEVELEIDEYEDEEEFTQEMIPQLEEMEAREDGDESAAPEKPLNEQLDGFPDTEGLDEMAYFDDLAPRSWASMAGRLKEGGGQLVQSKVQGYGVVAGAAGSKAAGVAASSGSSGSAARASDRGAAAERAAGAEGQVWLWVSRLPQDVGIEAQEVLDCLTSHLGEVGRAVDIERREQNQDWASVSVSSQEAAELIMQLSRDRKLLLRGRSVKAELQKPLYGNSRRGRTGGRASAEGGSKGAGRGRGPFEPQGGDEERFGESRGKGRDRRRPGKGHGGDKGGSWTAPS